MLWTILLSHRSCLLSQLVTFINLSTSMRLITHLTTSPFAWHWMLITLLIFYTTGRGLL